MIETILNYVNKMNLSDFENFMAYYFANVYEDTEFYIENHPTIKNVLLRLGYGFPERFTDAYIIHSIPYELYENPLDIPVDSPYIRKILHRVFEEYNDKIVFGNSSEYGIYDSSLQGIYFVNNLYGFPIEYYKDYLNIEYNKLVEEIGTYFSHNHGFIGHFGEIFSGVGNLDSFVSFSLDNTIALLNSYNNDVFETSISFSEGILKVRRCSFDKYITSGIGKVTKSPYCSLIAERINEKNEIINEFEDLINREPSESELEKFLTRYYKDLFGSIYDRIETQTWLKFPDIDITHKDRRLDIFLHNSIVNDWELFELKRIIPLTRTYRDVSVLTAEICYSIQQLRNYGRTLSNHAVKEQLKRDGIEYYEPSLNLVVGRESTLPHDQWRWLVSTNKEIKILTYDDLLSEMVNRLKAHTDFLGIE